MNVKHIFVLLSVVIIFSGCHTDTLKGDAADEKTQGFLSGIFNSETKEATLLKPVEYATWIQDSSNGLFVDRNIDGIVYSVQYKPTAFVLLQDAGLHNLTKHIRDSLYTNYSGYQYITLKIKNPGSGKELLKSRVSSEQEYQNRIYYCSFNIPQDIILVSGSDTLACVTHHFERVYGIAPEATFLFAFDISQKEREAIKKNKPVSYEDKTVILRDRLFQNGIIKFAISKEALNSIPELEVK